MTKVLVVGCGAVGQVFGYALQQAGVDLGLLDRPAVNASLEHARLNGGLPLFRVHSRNQEPISEHLVNYTVVPDLAGCRSFNPDQVWFTVPSPAYYSEWFDQLLGQVPNAIVVCFIPEGKRPEFSVAAQQHRLVFGGTTFMAWQADLDGSNRGGVKYWRSPLAIPLIGGKAAYAEVGRLLKQGGFHFSVGQEDSLQQVSMTALLTAFVAGLELSGWSLKSFRHSPWLKVAAGASNEAIKSQLAKTSIFSWLLLSVPILSFALWLVTLLLPVVLPFESEKYLQFHYTKTRIQSLALLRMFAEDGKKRNLPVDNIQSLFQGLSSLKMIEVV